MRVRLPAVAGTFYPADPRVLAAMIDEFVDRIELEDDDPLGRAYVVPHAGYQYSGPVAAHGFARLRQHAVLVRRVVLIGPAHRVPLRGCAVSGLDLWRTPLGEVQVDVARGEALAAAGLVEVDERPHAPEHSLEVQVPFLQRVLPDGGLILPICVGQCPADQVAAVIDAATRTLTGSGGLGGEVAEGTVVLCSTDLSHYLPDGEARERDRRTAAAVLALEPEKVGAHDACGVFALRGLLRWAGQRDLRPKCLALGTSADTAGDPDRVVGYSAFSLLES